MALPSAPTNPTPSHGANPVDAAAGTLTWTAVGATSCRVYLTALTTGPVRRPTTEVPGLLLPGITMSGTCTDLGGGAFAFNHHTGNPEAQTLPALGFPVAYAWQVIAANATGETSGPVWTFTAVDSAPATPSGPSPSDAGLSTVTPTLSWFTAARATSYDVYFGTTNPPNQYAAGVTTTNMAVGTLVDGTTYFWQIVARNSFSTAGPVWSFIARAEDVVSVLTSTTTGTINNFNAGTFSNINVLRMNNATLATITGLTNNGATPSDGMLVWIESVGAGQVDITNQDAGSTATNRAITGVTGTISLAAGVGRALVCYDNTTGRWRVLDHEQGAYIHPAYAAGNFTGFLSMTWTVDAGDVNNYSYYLKGRQLTVVVSLSSTSVGGTPSQSLIVAVPGGFSRVTGAGALAFGTGTDNGGSVERTIFTAQTTTIQINRDVASTNWSASTNATGVNGEVTLEVQ